MTFALCPIRSVHSWAAHAVDVSVRQKGANRLRRPKLSDVIASPRRCAPNLNLFNLFPKQSVIAPRKGPPGRWARTT